LAAREVEDRVVGAGGVAAAVRGEAQWRAEAAGRAVAAAPLVEPAEIGGAPPRSPAPGAGYRPHALERFGLGRDVLAERHPGLVVVSLWAWGSRGPWGDRRGFGSIVQAACGIAMAESPDGERPGAMPCQLLDHGTGYLCAAAALHALAAQAQRGGTQFRELSLARTAHWLLGADPDRPEGPVGPEGPAATTPADGDASPWLTVMQSDGGPVTAVLPPGQLDGTGCLAGAARRLRWRRARLGLRVNPVD
jgi:CoA-transferase family III